MVLLNRALPNNRKLKLFGFAHPTDVGFVILSALSFWLFTKGLAKQKLGYTVEVASLHIVISMVFIWWLRVISARYLFSFVIATSVVYGLGYASLLKQSYLGMPLLPWDIMLLPQIFHLTLAYGEVFWGAITGISLFLLSVGLFFVEKRNAARPLICAFAGAVLMVFLASGVYSRFSPYGIQNMPWDQNANYSRHGYLLGFVLNLKSLWLSFPSASSEEAAKILGLGAADEQVTANKPDVIVILSESYTSLPELFGLAAESCFSSYRNAGRMTTSTFGGFTTNVEFELLMGYPVGFFPAGVSAMEMYVNTKQPDALPNWFLKNGYRTLAIHTFTGEFWGRKRVFPLLGFERFIAEDGIAGLKRTGLYIDDNVLYENIKQVVATEEAMQPMFVLGISMQAHGGYSGSGRYPRMETLSPQIAKKLDASERFGLATYAAIVRDHEKSTCKFIDWLKNRKRETILVYFGDHLPSFGNGLRAYEALGIVSNNDPLNRYIDHRRLYTTPLFIWSNRRGFIPLPSAPVPTYALGTEIFKAAGLSVPPHFGFAARTAKLLDDTACCYVDRHNNKIKLEDTPFRFLYRHAWDNLIGPP